uniref:Uncharacterized protein n=1 Tax=Romanomermis culicivorax TaxID=13658 RepID=A0A915I0G1_ROMCU
MQSRCGHDHIMGVKVILKNMQLESFIRTKHRSDGGKPLCKVTQYRKGISKPQLSIFIFNHYVIVDDFLFFLIFFGRFFPEPLLFFLLHASLPGVVVVLGGRLLLNGDGGWNFVGRRRAATFSAPRFTGFVAACGPSGVIVFGTGSTFSLFSASPGSSSLLLFLRQDFRALDRRAHAASSSSAVT